MSPRLVTSVMAETRPGADQIRPLGQILLDAEAVTPEHLDQALALQAGSGVRLEEILIAHDWASPSAVAQALRQRRCSRVD